MSIKIFNNIQKKTIGLNKYIDPVFLLIIICILMYSVFVLWSASGQNIHLIERKIIQITIGLIVMILMSQIPPYVYENFIFYVYLLCLLLLLIVDIYGYTSKGAQRWLDINILRFQPSELIKLVLPIMISSFIHRNIIYSKTYKGICTILILIFIPAILIAKEPDLGTAILVAISGILVLILSGLNWKLISLIFINIFFCMPIIWHFFMQKYQKSRIIMLLYPSKAPFSIGYHITQSKIAISSGGLYGKGWLHGTQSKFGFLPECHTDFIFAVLAEELGLIGIFILFFLYFALILRGLLLSLSSTNVFGRITISSLMLMFLIYIFINVGMVSGIVPVVGVPLPIFSYGGSSLIVSMAGFGIIMSIHSYRNNII
ncbi:MAG: rod shape-determining protein RodA [Pantoea sp. Brub]|nr:rod shape-determining protein RodA [Pantoea sp. Brub]